RRRPRHRSLRGAPGILVRPPGWDAHQYGHRRCADPLYRLRGARTEDRGETGTLASAQSLFLSQPRRRLRSDDVAEQLDAPVASAVNAAASLGPALREAPRVYNEVHYPQTAREAVDRTPGIELIDHHTPTHGLPSR